MFSTQAGMESLDHWHAITVPLLKYANDKHVKKSALITELFFKQVSKQEVQSQNRHCSGDGLRFSSKMNWDHIISYLSCLLYLHICTHTRYLKRKLSSFVHVLGLVLHNITVFLNTPQNSQKVSYSSHFGCFNSKKICWLLKIVSE